MNDIKPLFQNGGKLKETMIKNSKIPKKKQKTHKSMTMEMENKNIIFFLVICFL
jgi:hypothetical protein